MVAGPGLCRAFRCGALSLVALSSLNGNCFTQCTICSLSSLPSTTHKRLHRAQYDYGAQTLRCSQTRTTWGHKLSTLSYMSLEYAGPAGQARELPACSRRQRGARRDRGKRRRRREVAAYRLAANHKYRGGRGWRYGRRLGGHGRREDCGGRRAHAEVWTELRDGAAVGRVHARRQPQDPVPCMGSGCCHNQPTQLTRFLTHPCAAPQQAFSKVSQAESVNNP